MELPNGTLTNIRAIDGFSEIHWRIYTPDLLLTPSSNPARSGDVDSRHRTRLTDVELKLRNANCLVASVAQRFGIWVFSTDATFPSLDPYSRKTAGSTDLDINGMYLQDSASGSLTSSDLISALLSYPQSIITDESSVKRLPESSEASLGHSTFYEALVSAVSRWVALQLTRRCQAIPLGPRTFATTGTLDEFGDDILPNNSQVSVSLLSTLDIELLSSGKLIITIHTAPQPGLKRLHTPTTIEVAATNIERNTDLWLVPHGKIARYIGREEESSSLISPVWPGVQVPGKDSEQNVTEKRKLWKLSVAEWLEAFGLEAPAIDDDSWLEVGICETITTTSFSENHQRANGMVDPYRIRSILWPAKFCFMREREAKIFYEYGAECFLSNYEDPLDFAEKWLAGTASRTKALEETNEDLEVAGNMKSSQKASDQSERKVEVPENLESLARTSTYLDLQAASIMYPTPPEGSLSQGQGTLPPSEGQGGVTGEGLMVPQNQSLQRTGPHQTNQTSQDNDVLMAGFDPLVPQVPVGSGLYDTGGDEDLFGDMDGKAFGSSLEPDFSFFDRPDSEDVGADLDLTDPIQQLGQPDSATLQTATESEKLTATGVSEETNGDPITTSQQGSSNPHEDDKSAAKDQPVQLEIETKSQSHTNNEVSNNSRGQTLSPPLSPVEIRKILFSGGSSESKDENENGGRVSPDSRLKAHYDPVSFQNTIRSSDQKYGMNGPFWFSTKRDREQKDGISADTQNGIPTVGFPKNDKSKRQTIVAQDVDDLDSGSTEPRRPTSPSSSASSDNSSEIMSEVAFSHGPFTGLKRKRISSEVDFSAISSPQQLIASTNLDSGSSPEENSNFLAGFLFDDSDWSFKGYFSMKTNANPSLLAQKDDQSLLAQLLVDQITQSSLSHKLNDKGDELEKAVAKCTHAILDSDKSMGAVSKLDLGSFFTLDGDLQSRQSGNIATHQGGQRQDLRQQQSVLTNAVSKLTTPHVRLRRGKDFIEVLPSAIPFWETFGLGPVHGAKDITAYCIHPRNSIEGADAFLDRLGLVYSSCNLGSHTRGGLTNNFDDGLVSWNANASESTDYASLMNMLKSACMSLGAALSKASRSKRNIVIYIINPFVGAVALSDICSAFLGLFKKYCPTDRQESRNLDELVLQVIPLDFIATHESIVVPTQAEYVKLALEVYNRCPPKVPMSDLTSDAPAFVLAETIPKTINFKLLPDSFCPLPEGKCLHLAISESIDQRWITAAWTNNTGSLELALSYCLRKRGSNVARVMDDVRQEIWDTTQDILGKVQSKYRVFLVKDDPMEPEEIEAWQALAERQGQSRSTQVELTILNANTKPELCLDSSRPQLQFNISNPQAGYSTTPGSTPRLNAPSPDPSGPVVTPGSINAPTPTDQPIEPDSESILVDVSDDSWGIVLPRRLNNSKSLGEYRPALASGALIKRNGPSDYDGIMGMTVNVVYAQRPCEALVKEVLQMYRNLSTLSRARGIIHAQKSTQPWHLATAAKGQEILSNVF